MLITILAARVNLSSDPHLIFSFLHHDHTQRLSDFNLSDFLFLYCLQVLRLSEFVLLDVTRFLSLLHKNFSPT